MCVSPHVLLVQSFISALKKELDQFDKDLGKAEKCFFNLLKNRESENWAKRVCDLFDSITDSKDKILLSTKTLNVWLSLM